MPGQQIPGVLSLAPAVHLAGEDSDATIDRLELRSARRALGLLKGKLGRARLLEVVQDEVSLGDAFLREHVQRSDGQQTTGTTTLRAYGISAAQFTFWLMQAFGREDVLVAAHPEHYSIHSEADGLVHIVETLGDHVCSFFLREWDDSAITGQDLLAAGDGATDARRSHLVLDDGTVVGTIATSFEEAPDGFTAHLSVSLPRTCGPAVIDQHLEHFAVEFRNWILTAAAEQSPPQTVTQSGHN